MGNDKEINIKKTSLLINNADRLSRKNENLSRFMYE